MLFHGHHQLLPDEHHAVAKARRKRIAEGREAICRRKSMAKSLSAHLKPKPNTERGTLWE